MFNTLKERIEARQHDGNLDSGDIVQTVVLIAGFVIVTLMVVLWLGTAMLNKGADVAACVESVQAPSVTGNDSQTVGTCETTNHASNGHSLQDTSEYQGRYGS